tara:strand:+ start:328 stop:1497 length:1170 start_codon:yes stop_codon:yes gene_type:complete
MKILFTASQETCLKNIIEIQKLNTEKNFVFESTFINQSNVFTFSNYDLAEIKKLKFKVNNLTLPFNFKKISDRKLGIVKRYLIYLSNFKLIDDLVKNHDVFIFSPGGFLEHKIAYRAKKYGKKTIFIEGGLQFGEAKVNKINYLGMSLAKLIKQIFNLNLFKFLIINDHYQELDYLITTGSFSKIVWSDLGVPEEKIYDIGVPRYKNLFQLHTHQSQDKNIIYATGAYIFHNDLKGEIQDLNNIKELYEIICNEDLTNKFHVLVHPRDSDDGEKILYLKSKNINIIKSDDKVLEKNCLLLTRNSTMVYEFIISGRNGYYYKPDSFRESIPHLDFRIYQSEQLSEFIKLFIRNTIIQNRELAYNIISKTTEQSSEIIIEKCVYGNNKKVN